MPRKHNKIWPLAPSSSPVARMRCECFSQAFPPQPSHSLSGARFSRFFVSLLFFDATREQNHESESSPACDKRRTDRRNEKNLLYRFRSIDDDNDDASPHLGFRRRSEEKDQESWRFSQSNLDEDGIVDGGLLLFFFFFSKNWTRIGNRFDLSWTGGFPHFPRGKPPTGRKRRRKECYINNIHLILCGDFFTPRPRLPFFSLKCVPERAERANWRKKWKGEPRKDLDVYERRAAVLVRHGSESFFPAISIFIPDQDWKFFRLIWSSSSSFFHEKEIFQYWILLFFSS